jgi:hypothetical protein
MSLFSVIGCTLILAAAPPTQEVTAAEKKAFLRQLKHLPTDGEFFTEAAVKKMSSKTRVLFALTPEDIAKYDIYPFAALSRGLLDNQEQRRYGVQHFSEIKHEDIKLFWACVLFEEGAASPEITQYLHAALADETLAKKLSEMVGPEFKAFQQRVTDAAEKQSKAP